MAVGRRADCEFWHGRSPPRATVQQRCETVCICRPLLTWENEFSTIFQDKPTEVPRMSDREQISEQTNEQINYVGIFPPKISKRPKIFLRRFLDGPLKISDRSILLLPIAA